MTEMTPIAELLVQCSFPMRPDAIAMSDRCRRMANTAVQDAEGALWWRCPAHKGELRPGVPGEAVITAIRKPSRETTGEPS
jgi:hypothetical protein